jgi:hypothetical protein
MSGMRDDFDHDDDLRGAADADLLALGLGGTNMMAMLWAVAMGRRAVGVEMRGDPFLGVHWNIRVDLYHQLGLIDRMMLERYGEGGVPRRANGKRFCLADCFYSPDTIAGDIVPDEVIDGYDEKQHIVGTIHHVEFIDDRWRHGLPNRVVTLLQPPPAPREPMPEKIRSDMVEVLDGPSTFQAGAAAILTLLRRYLEAIEAMDLAMPERNPRVRLFTRHRVIPGPQGFTRGADGRLSITIEALQELDFRGKFLRVRAPGSKPIALGTPELCIIAQGFESADAGQLGFQQHDVAVDHADGRGPVVAQADFLAGLIEVLVGGRLRRRISSAFDPQGKEYWIRQIAVGHENDPEVGWVLVQVPDFKTFDPVEAGLVGADVDPESPEYFAAFQQVVYDFYIEQCAEVLELPRKALKRVQMVYGPKLFSLVERVGDDAQVATNAVVAGDSFGNGHFLTSGGAMTGMVGHGGATLRYWRRRDIGAAPGEAIRVLATEIRSGTEGWLKVSAQEYSQAAPINFGAERIRAISEQAGIGMDARAEAIDASRRKRHSLLPLDPSDWRRLFLRNGRVMSAALPELHAMHPALRGKRVARSDGKVVIAFLLAEVTPAAVRLLDALVSVPGARVGVVSSAGAERLPQALRQRLAGFRSVRDCTLTADVVDAIKSFDGDLSRPRALFAPPELIVPAARAREALGLAGVASSVLEGYADAAHVGKVLAARGITFAPAEATRSDSSLEVMSVSGVPVWAAATRWRWAKRGGVVCLCLAREIDDPAGPLTRQMGYAALRALGGDTGLSTLRWRRRDSGEVVLTAVAPHAPAPDVVALMSLAHGAETERAVASALVNGLFAPIPRLYAAGVAIVPPGTGRRGEPRFDALLGELGALVVRMSPAESGPLFDGATAVFLRHERTDVIDAALECFADLDLSTPRPETARAAAPAASSRDQT